MICPDCTYEGVEVTCVFDAKQMGEVCTRCTRVFSIFSNNPDNKHYATEGGYRMAIAKDKARKKHRSVSTAAMVERIMRPID